MSQATAKYNPFIDSSFECPFCQEGYNHPHWNCEDESFEHLCSGEDGCGKAFTVEIVDVEKELVSRLTDEDIKVWQENTVTENAELVLKELGLHGEEIFFWDKTDVQIPAYRRFFTEVK